MWGCQDSIVFNAPKGFYIPPLYGRIETKMMTDIQLAQNKFENIDTEKRLIEGWASVEIVDYQGEIVPIDELEKSMYDYMDRGAPVIYGHSNKPVGKVLKWEIGELTLPDGRKTKGIKITAKIFDDYELDDEVWQEIKSGKLRGFSIGATARTAKGKIVDEDGKEKEVGILKDISLLEISLVEEPANKLALAEAVNYKAKGLDILYVKRADRLAAEWKGKCSESLLSDMVQLVKSGKLTYEEASKILVKSTKTFDNVQYGKLRVIEAKKDLADLKSLAGSYGAKQVEENGDDVVLSVPAGTLEDLSKALTQMNYKVKFDEDTDEKTDKRIEATESQTADVGFETETTYDSENLTKDRWWPYGDYNTEEEVKEAIKVLLKNGAKPTHVPGMLYKAARVPLYVTKRVLLDVAKESVSKLSSTTMVHESDGGYFGVERNGVTVGLPGYLGTFRADLLRCEKCGERVLSHFGAENIHQTEAEYDFRKGKVKARKLAISKKPIAKIQITDLSDLEQRLLYEALEFGGLSIIFSNHEKHDAAEKLVSRGLLRRKPSGPSPFHDRYGLTELGRQLAKEIKAEGSVSLGKAELRQIVELVREQTREVKKLVTKQISYIMRQIALREAKRLLKTDLSREHIVERISWQYHIPLDEAQMLVDEAEYGNKSMEGQWDDFPSTSNIEEDISTPKPKKVDEEKPEGNFNEEDMHSEGGKI
jgi:phage head maturation protease